MYETQINSSAGTYRIVNCLLSEIRWEKYDAIIYDLNLATRLASWPNALARGIRLEALEENKILETVEAVCNEFSKLNLSRSANVLAVGGGFVQDIATFAASIFHRGISWSFVPSTILAMSDSCVGGKSSLNLRTQKNALGNVYPPKEIFICNELVLSLSRKDQLAGLAESAKINFANGQESFRTFLTLDASRSPAEARDVTKMIFLTLGAKKTFVEKDEFDHGARQLLNFGHTFGHALETASNFKIGHGLAVAIGMLSAVDFSGLKNQGHVQNLCEYLWWMVTEECNREQLSSHINWLLFEKTISQDKKSSSDQIVLIIPGDEEPLVRVTVPKNRSTIQDLKKITEDIIGKAKK